MQKHLGPCCGLLLGCLAVWAAPAASDEIDQDQALQLTEQGHIMPLQVMIDDALRRFPGRFLEAELEYDDDRYIYELEIVTGDRRVIELEYDAATGTLLDVDIDEDD